MNVGPVVTVPIAAANQLRGDRVAVGLVVDQHASEVVTGLGVESFEDCAQVVVRAQTQSPTIARASPN
jgi:hypothetical protein